MKYAYLIASLSLLGASIIRAYLYGYFLYALLSALFMVSLGVSMAISTECLVKGVTTKYVIKKWLHLT